MGDPKLWPKLTRLPWLSFWAQLPGLLPVCLSPLFHVSLYLKCLVVSAESQLMWQFIVVFALLLCNIWENVIWKLFIPPPFYLCLRKEVSCVRKSGGVIIIIGENLAKQANSQIFWLPTITNLSLNWSQSGEIFFRMFRKLSPRFQTWYLLYFLKFCQQCVKYEDLFLAIWLRGGIFSRLHVCQSLLPWT